MLADSTRDRDSTPNFLSNFEVRVQQLIEEHVLPRALEIDPTDTGCCVALWDDVGVLTPHWKLRCVVAVGSGLTPDQYLKYGYHAMRKGWAVIGHPEHQTSFESRDTNSIRHTDHTYQGAARMDLKPKVLSTSGFISPIDEMADLLLGREFGWLSREQIDRIIELTDNDHARQFRKETGLI